MLPRESLGNIYPLVLSMQTDVDEGNLRLVLCGDREGLGAAS